MECVNLEYSRRPLPLELLVEMHKCLPLADAINVLVNVPSFAFVDINKPRMLRTIRQFKTSLNEYIGTLVCEVQEEEDGEKVLAIGNEIEWKPEMDALLRYGYWLTSTRKLYINSIGGVPENFLEKLLLHLTNSSSTQMMFQIANIHFWWDDELPSPTFLKPLFNEKQFQIENGFLFESVELKMNNGQILCIHDGEFIRYWKWNEYKLKLFLTNKMDECFKITIYLNYDKESVRRLKFKQWKMQSLEDVKKFIRADNNSFEDGNILDAKTNISPNPNLDFFLRRGARFTQFRHIKIKHQDIGGLDYRFYCQSEDYVDFLINFVSNAKHPEEFLESIDFDFLVGECSSSIKKLRKICQGIPKGGKFVNFDKKKLYILSAKIKWLEKENSSDSDDDDSTTCKNYKLGFTLANLPTNGQYLFDVCAEFGNGLKEIVTIKIQKRKIDDNIELNCNDQIAKKKLGWE